MQQQSGDGEQEGVSEWFQTSFGLVFWVPPALGEMKKEREKVEKERERDRERKREREREKRKMEDGDKQKARERERERETERGRGRGERESVVNGEQRGVSEWFQTSFCP